MSSAPVGAVRAVGDAAEVSCQLPVRLSLRSEPQPDFAIVKAKEGGHRKHPQPRDILLLIEVSDSTLRYDLGSPYGVVTLNGNWGAVKK